MSLRTLNFETSYIPPEIIKLDELSKKRDSVWENLDRPLSPKEQLLREDILELNPQKILVICNAGKNRSKHVAQLLNERGYTAENLGTGGDTPFSYSELLNKEYDAIILVSENVQDMFNKRVEHMGLNKRIKGIPQRVLGFNENSSFYLESGAKKEALAALDVKLSKSLDRLGFVDKTG